MKQNIVPILLVVAYFIGSICLIVRSIKREKLRNGGAEKVSDAILDLKQVNGIPVKITMSHVDATWMILANGTSPVISFRLHRGDYSNGKNGCDVDDLICCVSAIFKQIIADRKCGDKRLEDALTYLNHASHLISEHRKYCVYCNPDITNG